MFVSLRSSLLLLAALALVALPGLVPTAVAGDGVLNYHAVFIGNDDYAGTEDDLTTCHNDALDMYTLMTNLPSWQQCAVAPVLQYDATAATMRTLMQNKLTAADSDDIVFYFYSGHGSGVLDTGGDETSDATDETIVGVDLAHYTDDEMLLDMVTLKKQGTCVVVILDACYSGGVTAGKSAVADKCIACGSCSTVVADGGFFEDFADSHDKIDGVFIDNLVAMAAVRSNETATTDSVPGRPNNSRFTGALLTSVPTPFTAEDWFTAAAPAATSNAAGDMTHPVLVDYFPLELHLDTKGIVYLKQIWAKAIPYPDRPLLDLLDPFDVSYIYGAPGSAEGTFQQSIGIPTPDAQGWIGVDNTQAFGDESFVGDFSKIISGFTDIDPCTDNFSPQFGFIDDGTPPNNSASSTGGSLSSEWFYGVPGGWSVNNTGGLTSGLEVLDNEIWSPVIAWDLPGTADDDKYGGIIRFKVWKHLPLDFGMFYKWDIRTSDDNLQSWTPWRNENYSYYSNEGLYTTREIDITGLIDAGLDYIQIALGLQNLADLFGLPAFDTTPGVLFDNVSLAKYRIDWPYMQAKDLDLFHDAFSQSGNTDVSTMANRDLLDVRIDAGVDIGESGAIDARDFAHVLVKSVRPGIGISDPFNQIRMHWTLDVNPVFETSIRVNLSGSIDGGGGDHGWDRYSGTTTPISTDDADVWAFDLPDQDFMYPGDVLRYWFEAEDDAPGFNRLPAEGTYTMRALPTYSATDGSHPEVLVVNAGGERTRDQYRYSLSQIGMTEGIDFDLYDAALPGSNGSTGIGSAGEHGASADQLRGYTGILYEAGLFAAYRPSDGSNIRGNDKSDDLDALTGWWQDLLKGRILISFGRSLYEGLVTRSPSAGGTFLANVLGVSVIDDDVSPLIGGQTVPSVFPAVGSFTQSLTANTGCPSFGGMDAIEPAAGAVTSHEFSDDNGGTYANPAAGVLWDRFEGGQRRVSLSFPFSLTDVSSQVPNKTGESASSALLQEAFDLMGIVPSGPPTPSPETPLRGLARVEVAPNPFNPRTKIAYDLGARSRVTIELFDLRGRLVRQLVDETREAGHHVDPWDGRDDDGAAVASGVYLMRLTGDGQTVQKKVALLK